LRQTRRDPAQPDPSRSIQTRGVPPQKRPSAPPRRAAPPRRRKKKFSLRAAFRKAVLGVAIGVMGFGSFQYYAPQPYKDAVADIVTQAEYALHFKKPPPPDTLRFAFADKDAPVILGVPSKPMDNTKSGLPEKWVAMMGRQQMAMKNPENADIYAKWLSQLDDVRGKPVLEQAKRVDGLVDRTVKYQSDKVTYKEGDYWASPAESLANGKGDCEDIAILKYYALRYLGVPAERMYVIVVGDAPSGKIDHATLLVDAADYPSPLVPDSLRTAMTQKPKKTPAHFIVIEDDNTPQGQIRDPGKLKYVAYYAMNEKGVWSVPRKPAAKPKPKPTGGPSLTS